MKKLIIFGIGKISDVAYFHFKNDSDYEVAAFTVDKEFLTTSEKFGLPVIPFETIKEHYAPEDNIMFIATGYQDMNRLRETKCNEAKSMGYELASYISSRAVNVAGIKTGDNCMILDNVTIEPGTAIGNNSFIWSNSLLGHHSQVKEHCFISGNVTIGGTTTIENNCFLGLNSTIGHEIIVGKSNFIGAGTLILKSTDDKSVFITSGTPKFRLDADAFLKISKLK